MRIAEVIIPLNLDSRHVTKIIGLIQRETGDYCGSPTVELLLEYAGRYLCLADRPLSLSGLIANSFPRVNNKLFVYPKVAVVHEVCHIKYKGK